MTTIVGEDVEEERREGREGGRSLLLKNLISDDQTDVLLDWWGLALLNKVLNKSSIKIFCLTTTILFAATFIWFCMRYIMLF